MIIFIHRTLALSAMYLLIASIQQVYATRNLNHALVRDVMPPSSPKCIDTGLTSFNFVFSTVNTTASNWNPLHNHQEQEVFLAEISNGLDPYSTDHGWKLRVGQAGVIYSFIGAFGEAVPPQGGIYSPWNDEVWQQTMTNRAKNNPDGGGLYMIHQAGVYLYDDALTGIYPSPNALSSPSGTDPGAAISCEGNSCAFVSWGQHAHIPTPHSSNALYYTRVSDCGQGVVEYTMVTHNMKVTPDNTSDYFDLFTNPWMGLRGETFRDILTTAGQNTSAAFLKPKPLFQTSTRPDMQTTLGYTIFTQGISDDEVLPPFTLPCVDPLNPAKEIACTGDSTIDKRPTVTASKNNPCVESTVHTAIYGKPVIRCSIKTTTQANFGNFYQDLLLFNAKAPNNTLHIRGVLYWAQKGTYFYFVSKSLADMVFINANFLLGDNFMFKYTDIGYPFEQNHALANVHGIYDTRTVTNAMILTNKLPKDFLPGDWASSYIIFGYGASITRDTIVFGACHRGMLQEGETYRERSYYITDKLSVMDARAKEWVLEKYRDKKDANTDLGGREVVLFKYSATDVTFGGCLATENCGQSNASVTCKGWTTANSRYLPLFAMSCGSTNYVGTDRYNFTPPDYVTGYKRNYICNGEPTGTKPSYHLLGYFPYGSCDAFKSDSFDQNLCSAGVS